jgi:hypothetical protein
VLAPQAAINDDAPTHTSSKSNERADSIDKKLAPPATESRRRPLPDGHLELYAVCQRVDNARNQDADLAAPLTA